MHPQDQSLSALGIALDFKIEVVSQVLIAGTLLAGIAIGVATTLLGAADRGRLRTTLFVASTTAALLFVLGTVLGLCILPAMKHNAAHPSVPQIEGLISLSRVVVWSLLLGTIMFTAMIAALGFTYSRKAGLWTSIAAIATSVTFIACALYLNRIMTN